jgi:predicted ATPase/DNA-binding winged helix-turn-helix (wHTH) protein
MPSVPAQSQNLIYESGPWQLDLGRRELLSGGVVVPIGARALEILEVLVRSANELVSKDDLMSRIWPGSVVGENTLQVHISAIRKALGPGRAMLKTASGRGYRLVGSWTIRQQRTPTRLDVPERVKAASVSCQTNVPVAASALVGRETAVQHLLDLATAYRAVTLTGPGGIGKTVLASEVARRLFPTIESDVFFVELASLSDPDLVPSAVAGVLGLRLGGDEISPASVARAIGSRKVLLVLDNCEHVIDAAAGLAETLLRFCPRATVLATSREVLRIEGEFVYRVAPLDVPSPHQESSGDVLEHSAVQLFIARTRSLRANFPAPDENLPTIAAICRRLDGIPLAIEFAAAHAATLGIRQVAGRLDDRFALLTGSRRTALPRHQTLRATLDWSFALLPEAERRLLRHLAVFPAGFTLEAAVAVAGDGEANVALGISSLVSKSLVTMDGSEAARRWRLLETIRAYALEILTGSFEHERVLRRHAEFFRDLLAASESSAQARLAIDDTVDGAREIDNVRAALDWCFSKTGDARLGVALTAVALPLWMHFSLMTECRTRVEQALATPPPARDPNSRIELQLYHALGAVLLNIEASGAEMETALANALRIAEALDETDYRLRVLWCIWCHALNRGAFREAMTLADRFRDVAARSPDPADPLTGERMRGFVLHFLGDQESARRLTEYMLSRYVTPVHRAHIIRFQFDQKITARATLVQILWLQGFVDQASSMNEANVEEARAVDHTMSLCNALTKGACPLSLMARDLPAAERFIDMLLARSARDGLPMWHAWGLCFEAILSIKRGEVAAGLDRLQTTLATLPENHFSLRYTWVLGEYADGMRLAGRIAEGLETIETALAMSERDEELWCIAELLRIKGELLQADGSAAADLVSERCFRQSLDWARRQHVPSWELRATMSLARRLWAKGAYRDARDLLAAVYGRFSEGFGSADLIAAKQLIDRWSAAPAR